MFMGTVVSAHESNLKAGDRVFMSLQDGGLQIVMAPAGGRMGHTTSANAAATASDSSHLAGSTVCFSANGGCGSSTTSASSGTPSSAPSAAAPSSPAGTVTSAQYPFTLDEIGLRMSLQQVRAAVSTAETIKTLQKQGPTTYNLSTRDMKFQIEFTPDMHVRQYNVSAINPKHLKEDATSGPLYDKLVTTFGPASSWGNAVLYDVGEGGSAYAIVTDQAAH